MSQWQPIENAPDDASFLASNGRSIHIAYRSTGFSDITHERWEGIRCLHSLDRLDGFTHWMPLPAPPEPTS